MDAQEKLFWEERYGRALSEAETKEIDETLDRLADLLIDEENIEEVPR